MTGTNPIDGQNRGQTDDQTDPEVDRLSRIFAALADPTRRDIVARLTLGDCGVSELAAAYAVSLQSISKHVRVLEEAGLVSRSRDGQRRPVHLEAAVLGLSVAWIERHQLRAEERFARLDEVLRELATTPEP